MIKFYLKKYWALALYSTNVLVQLFGLFLHIVRSDGTWTLLTTVLLCLGAWLLYREINRIKVIEIFYGNEYWS